MIQDVLKFRTALAQFFNTAPVCFLALCLLSIMLLTGCTTISTYKPQTTAGPAKPAGYPVLVYAEDMTVPRPCEIIGTISIHDTRLTVFGGSVESEMKKVMRIAREKGADAIRMKTMKKPDFANPNYRLSAELLRYTDAWETLPITEVELANYLHANPRLLDPIEGIWTAYGPVSHRVAIIRNASKPGRDFIGFLLNTEDPTWRAGYKKIDIKSGPKPWIYLFDYYLDDFSKRATTVILGKNATFTLSIPTSEEKSDLITYARSH